MNRIFLIAIVLYGMSGNAIAMDKVGIYLLEKADLTVESLSSMTVGATVKVTSSEGGKSFRVSWSDVSILINMRDRWSDRLTQINGMSNWIASFNSGEKSGSKLLLKVESAKDLLGCVIEPGYDKEQKTSNLVKAIIHEYGGFVFTHQSFYGENGKKIVGDPNDPDTIGGT